MKESISSPDKLKRNFCFNETCVGSHFIKENAVGITAGDACMSTDV